jgi:hypothetical protein
MKRMRRGWLARCPILVLVLVSFGPVGCGSKRNSVSGTVTYKGRPLPSGLVVFVCKEGTASKPARIAEDGTYSADDVAPGSVTVCVDVSLPTTDGDSTEAPETQSKDQANKASPAPTTPYVSIPERYKDPSQSGLTFEVKPGKNVFNIPLQ